VEDVLSRTVTQLLNGLSLAMLLFMVAGGMTLIFSFMRVLNLSHGALYLLGGYLGYSVMRRLEVAGLAVFLPFLAVGALGLAMDGLFRRRLYGQPVQQILLTLGLALILSDAILTWWGPIPRTLPPPSFLVGAVSLPGEVVFPKYRLAIMGVGLFLAMALGLVWQRTRVGALLRACVDDRDMLQALGVDVPLLMRTVFVTGVALAALAGVLGIPYLGLNIGLDADILLYSVVILVIGGLGSLRGALIGSIFVGIMDTSSKAYFPEFSYFAIFGPALLTLLVRPAGLFGRV
jgi:branched-chain amino acid transport system permease protein